MKEQFKNIIITLSLIALVFTQGYLAYQKKVYKNNINVATQVELVKNNNLNLTKIEQNKILLDKIQKQQLAQQQALAQAQAKATPTPSRVSRAS